MSTPASRGTGPTPPVALRLPPRESTAADARPAFVGPDGATYGEVRSQVDAIASRLVDTLEVRIGDRIAIWMDKHPCYAETILAALQAGCAYVPLDGGQPAGRASAVLADAEPVALFTDRAHLDLLGREPLPASLRVVVARGENLPDTVGGVPVRPWDDFVRAAAGRVTLMPALGPGHLAALLYTSGSTGTPKGVQISHGNLAGFVSWARAEFGIGPGDVLSNHASFNFDLSTFDLFVALTSGAALWIVPDDEAKDVTALARGIREHAVSVWYSVPSALGLLVSSGALTADGAKSLRHVLFAGEVFPMPRLRALAGLLPEGTTLYNLYGPTETNVCTFHRVRPEDLDRTAPVPIGGPVDGALLTVLDEQGRTVTEPGTIGELVVGGDCVTPGYWRRAGDPAAALHCQGLHPTGDLVSYDEDGLLVYRGRKDRMVKISGYRVELGEIEAAVQRHPSVAEAAVRFCEGPGGGRLTLYYTLREGAEAPGLIQLKRHCAALLPTYMVPHAAQRLATMPHNANGKVDHRRLDGAPPPPSAGTTRAGRPAAREGGRP
ncbi:MULTISPECIES: D-alanine--poly(phosphoribitol) ligase [unclassified Streptomyces]|uniref:D-alanine--poly(phosphoribitol) ligase n=1 Tax=Streptomyces sp. WAC 01420 TaxID=2203203 RepID=UPI000F6EB2A8|nr:D-alanine--poly(phosphoribitol) ligase [Streptomyces sp. WAC 01438]RSM94530.1 D-alanine--poly(phosphoribitol) ligase [Streptomyces sp. WAC 01420]